MSIANEHKTNQNYQAGTCGAHRKQWRLTQRPSCQRRGNWPTAYRPTIYYLYLVENQTTTAKASHDSRLPRVLFEEKEERFLIPTTGASCAAKARTELFWCMQQHRTQDTRESGGTGIKMQLQRGKVAASQFSKVHV